MVMMGILVMIFGQVVHLDIPNYPAFVLSALLQALFYFTPIFYPLSYVPNRWLR